MAPALPPVRGHSSRTLPRSSRTRLSLEEGGDPRGNGSGGQRAAGALRLRDPGPHLEAGGAAPAADGHLVLHPERLLAHLAHRGLDPHLVAVAYRSDEARARLDDGHAHD